MQHAVTTDPTSERLLDEAEELFAHHGFYAVSVREITTAAGANLSAVNYHFGSKKNLYLEVFRQRWLPRAQRILNALPDLESQKEPPSLEQVVKTLARSFMMTFADETERMRHHLLIHRELAQPTEALDMIMDNATGPAFNRLAKLLRPHLAGDIPPERAMLCLFSIFSQILLFSFSRRMVTRLTGRPYDDAFVEDLVEHITSFSVFGLSGICREGAR